MSFKKFIQNWWPLLLILFVSCILFFGRLNKDLFWDWDECLYSVNTRVMHFTRYFLNNKWNGYNDLQKPPGYIWLLQIPSFFVINEFSVRLLSVFAGLGIIILVYSFSKSFFSEKVAILSSLLLLISELFVIYTTKANTDIFFTLSIFGGFYFWILSQKKSSFSYLSGLMLGLAVMVKGLGSLQFLIAIFLSIFINFRRKKLINFIKLVSVFALTIIPWHLLAYKTYAQDFIRIYFLENIIKRSQYPIEFHRERWWFYFVLIYRELFPWIWFVAIFPLITLAQLIRNSKFKIRLRFNWVQNYILRLKSYLRQNELFYTIILLIIVPIILLIRVKTKIAWYAMPIYPFLAIYLAYSIEFLFKKLRIDKFLITMMILIALDAGQLMIKENRFFDKPEKVSARNEVAIQASKYPQKELNYLVTFAERQARELLPPTEQIPQTWVFGGNPCAVYYSQKKVNYYYFTDEFKNKLNNKGLFLIQNGDLDLIKNLPVKVLFTNTDFTLFERI